MAQREIIQLTHFVLFAIVVRLFPCPALQGHYTVQQQLSIYLIDRHFLSEKLTPCLCLYLHEEYRLMAVKTNEG
jgi:hypothetical protein